MSQFAFSNTPSLPICLSSGAMSSQPADHRFPTGYPSSAPTGQRKVAIPRLQKVGQINAISKHRRRVPRACTGVSCPPPPLPQSYTQVSFARTSRARLYPPEPFRAIRSYLHQRLSQRYMLITAIPLVSFPQNQMHRRTAELQALFNH